jgi:glycine/D-amino acid oxidase-like deaminating enzyme
MPTPSRAYVKPDNVLRQLRELRRLVPAFAQVQLIRVWSGIEGYTADWQPVIGPSARTPGLHYAFGFNGEGFAISARGSAKRWRSCSHAVRRRRRSRRSRSRRFVERRGEVARGLSLMGQRRLRVA